MEIERIEVPAEDPDKIRAEAGLNDRIHTRGASGASGWVDADGPVGSGRKTPKVGTDDVRNKDHPKKT